MENSSPLESRPELSAIPNTKYWGDYLIDSKENPKRNYFVDQLQKNARYAVPLVRYIANFVHEWNYIF